MHRFITGKLFRVELHTNKVAQRGDLKHPLIEFGYCGNDFPPTEGQVIICSERYSLVIAAEEDCDDGNLKTDSELTPEDITVQYVNEDIGWNDHDGTCGVVLVSTSENPFDFVYALNN